MIVTLDGNKLETAFPPACTLQTVVDQVRAEHNNALIVSVAVDGQRLDEERLGSSLEQPVRIDAQVDLESGDPRRLVADALRGLCMEFEQVAPLHEQIAEQMAGNDASAAVRDLGSYIGLWNTTQRVLVQCGDILGEDLAAREYDGRTVKEWFEDVVGRLTEIRDALEARDMVLLADLVRYELPTLRETWQNMLSQLANEIGPGE